MNNYNKTIFRILPLFILLLCIGSLHAQTPSSLGFVEGYNYNKGVVYKTIDGYSLKMDIFYPEPGKLQEKNPWMLHVHGGAWSGGDMYAMFKTAYLGTFQNLTESGVVCISIDYRLAKAPVTSYESVIDAKDAVKYCIKNAEKYKLDEHEYGIWGGSAGAHLGLVTALAPDSLYPGDSQLSDIQIQSKCVAAFFPLTSCLNPDLRPGSLFADGSRFNTLLGGSPEEKPEIARLLSPTEFLEENSPSTLLLHGDNDVKLPIINSLYMMEVASEKNADVQLLTVKNGGHSFKGDNISPSFEEIADSCCSYLLSHLNLIKYATLSELSIENVNFKGFNAEVFEYDVVLNHGTTKPPTVSATASKIDATIVVTPASSIPGSTTVLVKNSDGGIGNYTINFTVATSVNKNNASNIAIYPNPTTNQLNITAQHEIKKMTIHNLSGGVVDTYNNLGSTTTTLNTNKYTNGLYVFLIETVQGNFIKKVMVE